MTNGKMERRGFLGALSSLLGLGLLRRAPAEERQAQETKAEQAPQQSQPKRATGDPKPKRCLLNRFFVAGLYYYDGLELAAEGGVKPGDALRLSAQPDNPYDRFAVEVFHAPTGIKLGYVPRTDNKHISRLLRRGVPLEARVVRTCSDGQSWEAVKAEVRLVGSC
jgi:hypothetical protein